MRRFKTTPQKKLIGMLILFVFIPLFLLWYVVFFLDNKPGLDTLIILGLIIVLALYFYFKYKKQIDAIASGKAQTPGPEEALAEEPLLDEEEFPESEEEFPEEPVEEELDLAPEKPLKKQK